MGQSKRVLITGVAGLLGSQLARWIIENHPDYRIIGVDNLSGGYMENVPEEVFFYNLDLSAPKDSEDNRTLKALFADPLHPIDYVFHFAAYAAEGLSPFMRHFNYENNIVSTVEIINNCIQYGVKRLVYTSSMSVYGHGKGDGTIFDEKDQPAPIDPYGISKYACEMDIKVAGEQHGLDWCIIRPHNIYGPNQNIWDKYRNVLGIWMRRIIHNEPILIYGDGTQTRAFTYVEDNLPCLWRAAVDPKCSKEIVNLGGVIPFTINESAETLKAIVEAKSPYKVSIEHREPRHEVKFAVPTYQKSIDVLGFEHKTPLLTGLMKMWEWVQTQPDREVKKWEEYEVDKGIYSYWK